MSNPHPTVDRVAESDDLLCTILDYVATVNGVSAVDLEPSLAAVIDPEALTRLVESAEGGPDPACQVQFRYAGCAVLVQSNGTVSVEQIEAAGGH